jgi:hypothetical protein
MRISGIGNDPNDREYKEANGGCAPRLMSKHDWSPRPWRPHGADYFRPCRARALSDTKLSDNQFDPSGAQYFKGGPIKKAFNDLDYASFNDLDYAWISPSAATVGAKLLGRRVGQ